jgi:hypothetical protein
MHRKQHETHRTQKESEPPAIEPEHKEPVLSPQDVLARLQAIEELLDLHGIRRKIE